MAPIVVDPASYEAAATVLGSDVAEGLLSIYLTLQGALDGIGSMAGSDPAGQKFGSAYDKTATEINGVTQDVINACYKLGGLLSATGFNHGKANASSVPGGGSSWTTDSVQYADTSVSLGGLPSGSGDGGSGNPSGWWIVEHTVGYVWPNGDSGKLRSAAAAWSVAARAITALLDDIPRATGAIAQVQSIEVAPATTACTAMGEHLAHLSAGYNAMSSACTAYAGYIDTCHNNAVDELESLLEWTAGIETVGILGSLVTFGGAEAGAQAVEAGRIAATAARIATIIGDLVESAGEVAEQIAEVVDQVLAISQELAALLGTEISLTTAQGVGSLTTTPSADEQKALSQLQQDGTTLSTTPAFSATPAQLQKKFKHAAALGVPGNYNPQNAAAFKQALSDFTSDPGTTTVPGTYNNQPAILAYNTTTGNIVIRHPDGSYWTNWTMSAAQQTNVITTAKIGGH